MADMMYGMPGISNNPMATAGSQMVPPGNRPPGMAANMGGQQNVVGAGDLGEDGIPELYNNPGGMHPGAFSRPRVPGLYMGNLTWWTTDQDVINAINSVGVFDVQEVKFFENRNNGQSKGFCVVTFASEASLPIVSEKVPKLELYGQKPVVTAYNKQNLNLFEAQTNQMKPPRPPQAPQQMNNPNNNSYAASGIMGISSIGGLHASTQGLPYSGLNNNYGNNNQMGGGGPGPMGGGGGGPRMPYQNMRPPMRGMRPGGMRGPMQSSNNPMMSGGIGHQMNLMRPQFMAPQVWNNSQNFMRRDDHREPAPPGSRRDDRDLPPSGRDGDQSGMSSSSRRDERSSSLRRDDRSSSSRHDDRLAPSSSRRDTEASSSSRRESSSSKHRDRDRDRDRERERDHIRSSDRDRDRGIRSRSREHDRDGRNHHHDHRDRSRSRERKDSRRSGDTKRGDRTYGGGGGGYY